MKRNNVSDTIKLDFVLIGIQVLSSYGAIISGWIFYYFTNIDSFKSLEIFLWRFQIHFDNISYELSKNNNSLIHPKDYGIYFNKENRVHKCIYTNGLLHIFYDCCFYTKSVLCKHYFSHENSNCFFVRQFSSFL